MGGFDDIFESIDDIVSSNTEEEDQEALGQKDEAWGEDEHWDTEKKEDVWRSNSPDSIWTAPKKYAMDEENPDTIEDDDEIEEEIGEWDENDSDEYMDDI